MNEEKYDLGNGDGMKMPKGKFGTWLENFLYHYKWHTIVALFLIVTITICSVQMCSKDSYDVYVMYAGSRDIKSMKNEGDFSEFSKVYKSLTEVTEDFDGNGENMPSLEVLYMLSSEEIKKIEEELNEKKENGDGSYELNYTLLSSNNQTFRDRMTYSEFYVCILSESLYSSYKTLDGVSMFTPLEKYVEDEREVRYLDECAIYLNSTGLSSLPGFSEMPEDTVICLRSLSAISSHFDKKGNEELYRNSEKVIKNMINYEK